MLDTVERVCKSHANVIEAIRNFDPDYPQGSLENLLESDNALMLCVRSGPGTTAGWCAAEAQDESLVIVRIRVVSWVDSPAPKLLLDRLAAAVKKSKKLTNICVLVGHEHDKCHGCLKSLGYWGTVVNETTYQFVWRKK